MLGAVLLSAGAILNFLNASMAALAQRAEFVVTNCVEVPEHGGSYRYTLERSGEPAPLPSSPTGRWIQREANETAWTLRAMVQRARLDGPMVGYGACAKGMVALQYAETALDYIVDETPAKVGKCAPGSLTPIVEPDWLAAEVRSVTVLVLAWNYYDAIAEKIRRLRPGRPTRFLRYMPRPLVLPEFEVPEGPIRRAWRTAA